MITTPTVRFDLYAVLCFNSCPCQTKITVHDVRGQVMAYSYFGGIKERSLLEQVRE